MKLSCEQIKAIAHGALYVRENESGEILLRRFTDRQLALYEKYNPAFHLKALGTAGVRLEFETDSNSLTLCYRATYASSRHYCYFDVFVDGVLTKHFGHDNVIEVTSKLRLSLPEGTHRVKIVFPNLFDAHICFLALDDGASCTPIKKQLKLLCMGDSITQGWETQFDSLSYAWRVARHFNADILNQGVGGAYYCEDTFDQLPFDPDVVTVAYGTNDFGHYHTLEELREHTKKHLTLISKNYAEKRIFVITPIWRGRREGKPMGRFEDCRAVIAEEAEALGLTVIDGLSLVPPIPVFFSDAYLHPNDCGMSLYAENLIIALEKYL